MGERTPVRIQRKRTKGWKMPPNTVYVGRPGPYRNPFRIGGYFTIGDPFTRGPLSMSYCECLSDLPEHRHGFTQIADAEQAVEWFKIYVRRYPFSEKALEALRGKNLACFCKLDAPCHADVLLDLANLTKAAG